jgi:porphobilinogen synthase
MKFPEYRLRRLRKNENLRKLFSETKLSISDFVMPYFVIEGKNVKQEINSMPGIFRYSIDQLLKEVEEIYKLGTIAVLLFGVPDRKDEIGSYAYSKDGIVQKAIKAIKKEIPDIVVITDVCLCSYTTHGHCGILKKRPWSMVNSPRSMVNSQQKKNRGLWPVDHGPIDNDATLEVLAKIALSHAEAGADIVAPSAMMDEQVQAIRKILDKNGFKDVAIMSYSAKYASSFYGPFREAADSSPKFGDRKSYQMNYCNIKEALREIETDINEGADIVMVKPALSYLDVIRAIKEKFNVPLAAYNVSGEYSMVKAAAQKNWLDEKSVALEILTSIKRAGADIIITYWAKDVAEWVR